MFSSAKILFSLPEGRANYIRQVSIPRGKRVFMALLLRRGLPLKISPNHSSALPALSFAGMYPAHICRLFPAFSVPTQMAGDEREFLADYFPSMSKMATNIFLKGYQWPFDPQRIENCQSSLIDILVFNETQKGRRVFMDFRKNLVGNSSMKPFCIEDLEEEAAYLSEEDRCFAEYANRTPCPYESAGD